MNLKRKHLSEYAKAHRDLELTETAINILERVSGAQRMVTSLKRSQRKHLVRLDAAAAKLAKEVK